MQPDSLLRTAVVAFSGARWLARQLAESCWPAASHPSSAVHHPEPRRFSAGDLAELFGRGVVAHLTNASRPDALSIDSLRDEAGAIEVSPRSHLRPEHRPKGASIRFKTFADRAFSEKIYPYQVCVSSPLHAVLPDEVEGRPRMPEAAAVFVGGRGHVTLLHYDMWHGLLFQLVGTKHLVMFEPAATRYLYARSRFEFGMRRTATLLPSPLSQLQPGSFPNIALAPRWELTLHEGDAVYIPPFWWHEVTCKSSSVSAAVRYRPNWRELATSSLFPLVVYQARWNMRERVVRLVRR